MHKRYLRMLAGVFAIVATAGCDDQPAGIADALEPSESFLLNNTVVQVDRMGFPAINTAFVADPADKDAFNAGVPADDEEDFLGSLATPGIVPQVIAARYGLAPTDAFALADFVLPDIMPLGTLAGFPNGRAPADDVIDVELTLIFGAGASDNVDGNDTPFLASFPYLATPHGG